MIKEAIEKIEQMSRPLLHTIGDNQFTIRQDGTYKEIRPDMDIADTHPLHSLDALVQMIKTEALPLYDAPVYIEASGHDSVTCFLRPSAAYRNYRQILYTIEAKDVPGWKEDDQLPYETAIIAVRTRFQQNNDTEYLLRLLSEISNGAKVTYADNGVATTVITQKGVSIQGSEAIRPIVNLKPYRTFQEVDQPESLFHIRISERGIRFIEADGGMWKLAARRTIVSYMAVNLTDAIEDGRVVVML